VRWAGGWQKLSLLAKSKGEKELIGNADEVSAGVTKSVLKSQ